MSLAIEIADLISKHHPAAFAGNKTALAAIITDLSDNLGSILATAHRGLGDEGTVRLVETMLNRIIGSATSIEPDAKPIIRLGLRSSLR